MKIFLSLIFPAVIFVNGIVAQAPAKTNTLVLKRQTLADDTETRAKDVPYTAIRVYIRYKVAEWLWKNGKDDTGRALPAAKLALQELYANQADVPNNFRYKLAGDLFNLLDRNEKAVSAELKATYKYGQETDLFSGLNQLKQPGGDQILAANLIRSFRAGGEFDKAQIPLISLLGSKDSPVLPELLTALFDEIESGRLKIQPMQLIMISSIYSKPAVPQPLKVRIARTLIDIGRRMIANPSEPGPSMAPTLLGTGIALLGDQHPELASEAKGLMSSVRGEDDEEMKKIREVAERIERAEDKVMAYIEAAEMFDNVSTKRSYYVSAERLAKTTDRLAIALDVVDKVRDLDPDGKDATAKYWVPQEYAEIARMAFAKDNTSIGIKATERIVDPIEQALAWRSVASYFINKNDQVNSSDCVGKMLKLLSDADREDSRRAPALVSSLAIMRKADPASITQAISLASKAINDLPSPRPEDTAGTEGYTNYVGRAISLNLTIGTTVTVLLANSPQDAADFVDRIQRKEFKAVGEFLVDADKLDKEKIPVRITKPATKPAN